MPEGGVVRIALAAIHTGAEDTLPPGRYIRIRISDTGRGMSPTEVDRVFTPYFTTRPDGHGLGLFIVYSIVKRHGGSVDVLSSPGLGTTFDIRLPASEAPTGAASKPDDPARSGEVKASGRVLVMDDEESVRRVLTTFLHRLHLDVEAVSNGEEAIRAFREAAARGAPFRLAIMDLTVPGGLGGLEALRALQETDPALPAIVISGYSDDAVLSRPTDFGFRTAVPKPFSLGDLRRAVLDGLGETGNRDGQVTAV
jgi:CheY-like chemotaxis protein